MDKFDEAKIAFEAGIQFDPENTALKSGVTISERALKIDQIIPKGVIVPVPIVFSTESPHGILWDVYVISPRSTTDILRVDKLLDWYTDAGITTFWACSPAAEYTHLANEECIAFTKHVVDRCKRRKLAVISGVRSQNNMKEYAEEIKVHDRCGTFLTSPENIRDWS